MKKNKQRLKLKGFLLIFLMLVLLLTPPLFSKDPYPSSIIVKQQLLKQGYSSSEVLQFNQSLKVDQILKLSTLPYQPNALERLVRPHFNEMMDLGYTATESRVLSTLPSDFFVKILHNGQVNELLSFFKTDYFIFDRLSRYLDEQKRTREALRLVVEKVNADRDYAAYTHTVAVDLSKEILLVNKYHYLPSSYEPRNLIQATGCGNPTLVKEAAEAYSVMCKAIEKDGISGLSQWTAYRSYSFQKAIYDDYVRTEGQAYTDTFAARPGFSEHQTGLSVDVASTNPTFASFEDTDTYVWLKKNAPNYGFILRYPAGKEAITGYKFESWHYRYVGVETAKTITKLGITLDEYWLWIQQ